MLHQTWLCEERNKLSSWISIRPIEAMLPERLRITSLLQKPKERNAKVELERKVYYN